MNELYVGIDLGAESSMISIYREGMEDASTLSTVPGEEHYQIPMAIFQTEQGKYFYGAEALKREHRDDGNFFTSIYEEALKEKDPSIYHQMLVVFIKRLLKLIQKPETQDPDLFLAITVSEITTVSVSLLEYVRDELGLAKNRFLIMDYAESFYAHTYHQDRSVWLHDCVLFDFTESSISSFLIHKSGSGRLQKVECQRNAWRVPAYIHGSADEKDTFFAGVVKDLLTSKVVSSIYLTGDGFDGKWLKKSLQAFGPNKRVFLGKNLFTKGACFQSYCIDKQPNWPYYFDAPYKFKGEVKLRVLNQGSPYDLLLVDAGTNWFQTDVNYRLLYDGNPKLTFLVQTPDHPNQVPRIETLDHLPARPDKTIRFCITLEATDGYHARIHITDDGFGELFESSGKTWDYDFDFRES